MDPLLLSYPFLHPAHVRNLQPSAAEDFARTLGGTSLPPPVLIDQVLTGLDWSQHPSPTVIGSEGDWSARQLQNLWLGTQTIHIWLVEFPANGRGWIVSLRRESLTHLWPDLVKVACQRQQCSLLVFSEALDQALEYALASPHLLRCTSEL